MIAVTDSDSTKSICILGGGGYLGSHLIRRLLEETEYKVRAVDKTFEKLNVSSPRLERVQASIREPGLLDSVTAASEILVSTTALCTPALYNQRPVEVIEANFLDLVPLIDLCTERERWLIHFSTSEVYGTFLEEMNEDESPLVLGPVQKERWTYASAKQLLERLIWAHGQHRGLAFTIVRPFNVIGPRMDYIEGIDGEGTPRVLACFMRSLLFKEPLQLVDGGRSRRSFVSVDDFTDAVVRIVKRPERCRGEIINIGNPQNDVSIRELAEKMAAIYRNLYVSSSRLSFQNISGEVFYGPGYDDSLCRVPDISKAKRLLDWNPGTSLDDMLPDIIEDYVNRYSEAVGSR
jgi:UDP-apiose/xylose synthase